MEFNQETSEKNGEETNSQSLKQWFQDNLRIIVSILVVVLIAGGIYSYSNRSQAPAESDQQTQSDVLSQVTGGDSSDSSTADQAAKDKDADQKTNQEANQQKAQPSQSASNVSQGGESKETDSSFIETAGRGDGATKLARKALADYLEKNPDSSLTAEHKIYIEDFLRKNVGTKGGVKVGTSVEFSKSLINDAISKSKNLNERQLKNLHKYAVRVPSLS